MIFTSKEQFIDEIAKYVKKYAPMLSIRVYSPIIAQAILESGMGTSELAVNANNYFGLKYKPGRCPTATGIYYKIGSEQNPDKTYTSSQMQWCKFDDMENCVIGYFDFISIPNYANLRGVSDPETYLKNIKADGYATSIDYVKNLMRVIETYNLTKYDDKLAAADTYTVQSGDTLSKIGQKTGIAWKTIAQINNIKFPYIIKKGQVLKLKETPKASYIINKLDYTPVFDPMFYSSKYPDLKAAFGTDATKLFNHFKQYGMKEHRQAHANFNPILYKNRYADLSKAFGNNWAKYYEHYIVYGIKENRKAN